MSFAKQVIREREEKINQILDYANASRKAELFTDVCVQAGKKSFHAHRLILSCYSVYFRTMFQTEMKEKYAKTIKIESVNETSLGSLINFIYTKKICINQENVYELLAASDYLQIDEAKQFCFDFLSCSISIKNCFTVLKTADLYQNIGLLNTTFQFICDHLAQISSTRDFKIQTKEDILELITKLNSDCVDERLVYDAIIGWVKHKENRKHDFAELFLRLNLNKFSSAFLAETISTETLVIRDHVCSTLVMKTFAKKFQGRAVNVPSKILSVGGLETSNEVFAVYNDDENFFPMLPQKVCAHCSLKLGDFVYCIGGDTNTLPTDKVWRMQIKEGSMEWEEVASMKFSRSEFGAAAYKNGIAIAGGWSHWSSDAKKSVNFFNPILNQWSELPSMNEGRTNNALVTSNNCLFCLGGYHAGKYLSSAEMLCDVNGTWQEIQPMQTPRFEFAAINCMDKIYAIGGRNDQHKSMKSVEKYDSRFNKWIYVKEMNIERRGHSACVLHDKMFVVGGKNAEDEFVSEIECYDPLRNSWSIVENINEKLLFHSIVAI